MIRRSLFAAVSLAVLGGLAAPALASDSSTDSSTSGKDKVFCVSLGNSSNSTHDGVCVWVPTN